jgi:hypothetical protein
MRRVRREEVLVQKGYHGEREYPRSGHVRDAVYVIAIAVALIPVAIVIKLWTRRK